MAQASKDIMCVGPASSCIKRIFVLREAVGGKGSRYGRGYERHAELSQELLDLQQCYRDYQRVQILRNLRPELSSVVS